MTSFEHLKQLPRDTAWADVPKDQRPVTDEDLQDKADAYRADAWRIHDYLGDYEYRDPYMSWTHGDKLLVGDVIAMFEDN